MSDQPPASVLHILMRVALFAAKSDDPAQIDELVAQAARDVERACHDKDVLLDDKAMVALFPYLFKNTTSLRNHRARNSGPPYIKVGDRAVYYRKSKVEAWIVEHEKLTNLMLEAANMGIN